MSEDKPYQVMPDLPDDEFERLKNDIEAHGLEYPILVDPDGNVIDGHHRKRACDELGIDPKTQVVDGTDDETLHRAYRTNLLGRDLGNGTKREAVKQYLLENKERVEEGDGDREIAADLGVSKDTVNRARNDLWDDGTPSQVIQLASGDKKKCVRYYLKNNPGASNREVADELSGEDDRVEFEVSHTTVSRWRKDFNRVEVIHSNFTDADIEPESVDHIITDPPYGEEHLDTWSELSAFADRVLKPGGYCIAYSGKYHLPEVLERLGKHIEYYWQLVVVHDGPGAKFFARNLRTGYKPILIFQKPPVESQVDFASDIIEGTGREKDDHDWQQAEGEAAELIDRFTNVDDRICDPMAGSGTVAVAAKRLDRRCVSIDRDKEAVKSTEERVNNEI